MKRDENRRAIRRYMCTMEFDDWMRRHVGGEKIVRVPLLGGTGWMPTPTRELRIFFPLFVDSSIKRTRLRAWRDVSRLLKLC